LLIKTNTIEGGTTSAAQLYYQRWQSIQLTAWQWCHFLLAPNTWPVPCCVKL
jgi:hypothetical protein